MCTVVHNTEFMAKNCGGCSSCAKFLAKRISTAVIYRTGNILHCTLRWEALHTALNGTAHCAEILRNLIPKHHISCHLVPWERSASGTTTCIGCSCGAHKDVLLDLFQSCLGGAPQCQCQAGKVWFLCTIVVFKSWPKHCPRRRLDVFPNQTNSRPVFVCQVLNSAPVQCFRLKWITFWHVL